MSSGGYQQYGDNPYSQAEEGYGQSNPYSGEGLNPPSGYGASNPYGGNVYSDQTPSPYGGTYDGYSQPPPLLTNEQSNYSQSSHYSTAQPPMPPAPPTNHTGAPLPLQDFLGRIDGVKLRIGQLSASIQEIASIHQKLLSSTDARTSGQLEALVSDTQVRNTQIKDEIKFLERDAARDPTNSSKRSQIESLKRSFKSQLDDFYAEESNYSKRYREAIARQYRIVNPEATEEEVQEAATADWGEEGIFTQALKSNRTGQASSVLGAVRARHNDIQRIEKTMAELSLLFQQLDEQVVYQQTAVDQTEEATHQVIDDSKAANVQLDRGIKHARHARKLKWWLLFIVVLICCILALVLGLVFGLRDNK